MKTIEQPIFFIGVPRSGTTITYELFSKHPDLAWLSNFSTKFPTMTWINLFIGLVDNKYISIRGIKPQYNSISFFNKFMPKTDEGYNFWNLHTNADFSRDYLLDKCASDEEINHVQRVISKIVSYRGKKRFTAKLTGPGRISYLNSIFPDAIFIHIIRDGRSVTDSLMKVGFWKNRKLEPWWRNGLNKQDLHVWKDCNLDPYVLTAIQWNRIIETTQSEAKRLTNSDQRYLEVRYEDFVKSPKDILKKVFSFCGLESSSPTVINCLNDVEIHSNFNKKYLEEWDHDTVNKVSNVIKQKMQKLDYEM